MKKKLLLGLAAACMLLSSVNVNGQGKSCDTSGDLVPMFFLSDGAMYSNGAWYHTTVSENSVLNISLSPSGLIGKPTDVIKVYKGCSTEEAYLLSGETDIAAGALQYFMEPGITYKIKINLTGQTTIVGTLSVLPVPLGETCMNPIVLQKMTGETPQAANTTVWYQVSMPWSAPLAVNGFPMTPDGAKISVISKHMDCNSTANENLLMSHKTKVKKGINLIRVTTDMELTPYFSMELVANCANRPERSQVISENTETRFENAVYDNYWIFTPSKTGTYTITNNAPEGTILKVGDLVQEADKKTFCDFDSNIRTTTVGSNKVGTLNVQLTADSPYIICSDLFTKFPAGSMPSILVKEAGSGISTEVSNESKDLVVTPNPSDGRFTIQSYLLTEGAAINVYTMSGQAIYRASTVDMNGTFDVELNNVEPGTYFVLVIGKSKSASTKIIIK